MKDYFFTFSFDHGCAGFYVIISGENAPKTRNRMTELFGDYWDLQYENKELVGIKKFQLKLLNKFTTQK